jgi:hypothetical protein
LAIIASCERYARPNPANPLTYGDVDAFVNMLLAACDDSRMNETLEMLLSMPDHQRRIIVGRLVERLKRPGAPQALIEAMACLLDDVAAEKAYEAIYRCAKKLNSR